VFFSDERCVSLDDGDSNFKSVQDHVLTPLGIKLENVVTIDSKVASKPKEAAERYEEELKNRFPGEATPSLDLILLGMGPDGHTCSLFPDHPLLQESKRLIAYIENSPKPPPGRITFTYPLLNNAKGVAFISAGASKASALKEVMSEKDPLKKLPAGRIIGKVQWFVDKDAASELPAEAIKFGEKPEGKEVAAESKL